MDQADIDKLKAPLNAEASALAAASNERAVAYRQRFRFSLAIGNAAGLVYVGAMITADKPILDWWHVLPSAWLFVAGAAFGSGMLFVASLASTCRANRWKAHLLTDLSLGIREAAQKVRAMGGILEEEISEDRPDLEKKMERLARRYGIAAFCLEFLSAASLAAGVIYPLAVLSSRTVLAF